MRLTITTMTSLDGVCQAPGGSDEDREGGFALGGWVAPHFDEPTGAFIDGVFARAEAFLLGRRTYEIFAGYWPARADEDDAVPRQLNTLPKHVASRTVSGPLEWDGSRLLQGDAIEAVRTLKAQGGDGELQVHGSLELARDLLSAGLVDGVNLLTFPVLLGDGKRLFDPTLRPAGLAATRVEHAPAGTVLASYDVVGEPQLADFDPDA